jgi:tRNA dimethylallyltransferase
LTIDQAGREILRKTKKFARRQETWLRRDERITWLEHDRPDLLEATLAHINDAARFAERAAQPA